MLLTVDIIGQHPLPQHNSVSALHLYNKSITGLIFNYSSTKYYRYIIKRNLPTCKRKLRCHRRLYRKRSATFCSSFGCTQKQIKLVVICVAAAVCIVKLLADYCQVQLDINSCRSVVLIENLLCFVSSSLMRFIPIEAQQRTQSNSCWPVRDESFIASSPIAHVIDPRTAVCVDTSARGRLRHDDALLESRHPVVYSVRFDPIVSKRSRISILNNIREKSVFHRKWSKGRI